MKKKVKPMIKNTFVHWLASCPGCPFYPMVGRGHLLEKILMGISLLTAAKQALRYQNDVCDVLCHTRGGGRGGLIQFFFSKFNLSEPDLLQFNKILQKKIHEIYTIKQFETSLQGSYWLQYTPVILQCVNKGKIALAITQCPLGTFVSHLQYN